MQEQVNHYLNKLNYEIDSSDVYEALQKKEKIIVIDARKPQAYQTCHIPSALNLPHKQMNEATTKMLDKSCLYVVYCDGIGCNASTKGALNMTRLGFKVKELLGGLDWWKRDGYMSEDGDSVSNTLSCGC